MKTQTSRGLAWVTGASAGFGRAIALRLAREGWRVLATARREDRLSELARELGPSGRTAPLDVRDRAAVAALFATLPPEWADIDLLVNNAGLAAGLAKAQEASLDDWDAMVDTNVRGLMYCTRAALPGMVARGRGHVINLGSVAGEFPYPGGNVYGATKAFVRQFSLNLKADLLGTGVRVTDVEPGLCGGTEFSEVRFKGDLEQAAQVYRGTDPLTAGDIAETVAWIAGLPARVNVNTISLMPACQAFAPFAIQRGPGA